MHADIVRLGLHQVDLKVTIENNMHVLQWRRHLTHDEVLLDGKTQATSYGLFGREKVYGLVFGRKGPDSESGERVMLIVDPATDHGNWASSRQQISGIRLETSAGPIVAYGSLDPKALEKPDTFADWMKKSMGMDWGK